MELDSGADFVEADEESLDALVRRKSKADRGKNLKENFGNDIVKSEMDMDFFTTGSKNIDINPAVINPKDEAANQICKRETKMNMNFAASDDEFSSCLVLKTSELRTGRNMEENIANGRKIMSGNIEVGFNKVQNNEVERGGKSSDAEQSQVTTVEHIERHENNEYFNGESTAFPLSVDPSNKCAVFTDVPVTHLKAKIKPSVYYAEDKGLWKCRHCSWVYPVTNPGKALIKKHKEHCEGMNKEKVLFEKVFPIKNELQKGSQMNANLGRGSETIDYESKETEVVVSQMVSQTMAQKQNDQKWPITEGIWQSYYTDSETSTGAYVTQSFVTGKYTQIENMNNGNSTYIDSHIFSDTGSTATARNGGSTSNQGQEKTDNSGIEEHQHSNGVSKNVLQKSQDGLIGVTDEKQLSEHQIRIPEKSALEGKVEHIVKILKEQETHDLICPNCGSCITKRVILRKRKRTSLVSEVHTDVQSAISEEEHEMTEDQSNMPEMSTEHGEESEAYGCLACLSLFFRKGDEFFRGNENLAMQHSSENLEESRILVDKEKDSFYCFQFLYPRDHSKPGAKADDATKISQVKNGEQTESIPKTIPSESNLRMVDTFPQNASLNAIPAPSTGTGSLLKNDGEKTAAVNEAGLDEDVAENVISDSRLNVSDKDVTLTESNEKLPNPAVKHPSVSIQDMKSHTSTTAKSTLTYSRRMDNSEIKENNYTTTERTKSSQSSDGDSVSLQLQEQYLRLPKLDESKHLERQHVNHNDVEVPEDHPQLATQGKVSSGLSDTVKNKEPPSSQHRQEDEDRKSDKKDYICNCIPVSIPTVWSMWSSKELIADELKKPLLRDVKDKQTIEEVPVILRDDQKGNLKFPSKLASAESSSSLETLDSLVKRKGADSIWPMKVDGSVPQSAEISPDSQTDGRAATVIDMEQPVDSRPENTGTLVSELSERLITEVAKPNVVTDWDLLKSIVYGGLTVLITSLGVVSSAAGGEAKTLTVIAISLANLVAGFFLIITNILYLGHFRRGEFEETVGQRFWFNGFIAILSYLIFGSLAPITYGFSFRKSNDRMYKFLAASLVSLISITLLALGKARVNKKSYIKIVILYVVTGFWASFIGFFAGKYIKKLLEKWGFTTD